MNTFLGNTAALSLNKLSLKMTLSVYSNVHSILFIIVNVCKIYFDSHRLRFVAVELG